MLYLILVLNEHRIAVAYTVAVSIWIAAYYWYFGPMIWRYFYRGKAHNWSVDLATKKAVANGREELY